MYICNSKTVLSLRTSNPEELFVVIKYFGLHLCLKVQLPSEQRQIDYLKSLAKGMPLSPLISSIAAKLLMNYYYERLTKNLSY